MSKDYAIEVITVSTPTGNKVFITNRNDYRTEERLAREVPEYFNKIRGLGDRHYFVSRVYQLTGLSKEQGEKGLAGLLAWYNSMCIETLNASYAVGKDRPILELVTAV